MAMLESLKDILSDALIVAPLVQTGDFHSYVVQDSQSTVTNQSPSSHTSASYTSASHTSASYTSASHTSASHTSASHASFLLKNRTKTFFYVFVHQVS